MCDDGNTGGTGDSPVIPPNKSRASEPGLPGGESTSADSSSYSLPATRYPASFDTAALHAQLADLLQIYLARAGDPRAVKSCSAKDAIACARTLTAMMSDLQSGRPASVKKATTWSRLESSFVGARHAVPVSVSRKRLPSLESRLSSREHSAEESGLENPDSSDVESTCYSPILEDALSVVLASTEESTIPEPYLRFIARADKLCKEVRQRLDAAKSRPATIPPSKNQQLTTNNRSAVPT